MRRILAIQGIHQLLELGCLVRLRDRSAASTMASSNAQVTSVNNYGPASHPVVAITAYRRICKNQTAHPCHEALEGDGDNQQSG